MNDRKLKDIVLNSDYLLFWILTLFFAILIVYCLNTIYTCIFFESYRFISNSNIKNPLALELNKQLLKFKLILTKLFSSNSAKFISYIRGKNKNKNL